MKILVIMKRFGANKDMPLANFGRQIRLCENLTAKHTFHFICPDYKLHETKVLERGGIRYYIQPFSITRIFSFVSFAGKLIKENKYDAVMGSTDPVFTIIGRYLAGRAGIPHIYEMQDIWNIYDSYKIPFIKGLDKRALQKASAVICVSKTLQQEILKINPNAYVVENGAELELFKPMDRQECRARLGLPMDAPIIGYIGQVYRYRGAHLLFAAYNEAKKALPGVKLLLSGKVEKEFQDAVHADKDIIMMELPERIQVVYALNAADVLVIPNPDDDAAARYCFPYKLLEYMATNTPIIATAVGDVADVLKDYPGSLCKPDVTEITEGILCQMKKGKVDYRRTAERFSWPELSKKLDQALMHVEQNCVKEK